MSTINLSSDGNIEWVKSSDGTKLSPKVKDGVIPAAETAASIKSKLGISTLSGSNTGDQTSVSGNAGTATKLQTARTINGVNFDGTANITVADATKVPTTRTVNGKALSADITLAKADVGLGNVDNTADTAKPVSTAQQTALNAKVTGTVKLSVGTTAPSSPSTNDLWVDTN